MRLKRVRAMLALVRGAMPEARRRSDELKAIADALAPARDPSSMAEAFAAVSAQFGTLDAPAFSRVESVLRARADASQHGAIPDSVIASARVSLEAAAASAARWAIHGRGFSVLRDGFERSYRVTRVDRARAFSGDGASRHAWRVRVKRLADQLWLIRPAWPDVLGAHARDLREVGTALGEDHDLWLLSEALLASPGEFGDERSVRSIARLAIRAGRARVRTARRPARRALAEKPGAFVARAEALWHAWRTDD